MNVSKFYKKLTSAEVGSTKTHEIYIRMSNDFDYESFFSGTHNQSQSVIEVNFLAHVESKKNTSLVASDRDLRFVYFANSNKEKRIPGLGNLFKDYEVEEGDVVCLERSYVYGVPTYTLTFFGPNQVQVSPACFTIIQNVNDSEKVYPLTTLRVEGPLQQIFFGAPGTGKSHTINQMCAEYENYRTTFHPDTDYAAFVGSYKPITVRVPVYGIQGTKLRDEEGKTILEDRIVYRYIFQSFLKAYIAAWREQQNEEPKPVFLIIEEINRGNCAQIFGDIFQLLDRNEAGFSDYPIVADDDLAQELKRVLGDFKIVNAENINALYKGGKDVVAQVKSGSHLLLPNNLYIWATMNTSDQSLFPIDSAFKRRWDWKYIKIKDAEKGYRITFSNGHQYDWWQFISAINAEIEGGEIQQEDKKLGYFFAKTCDGKISAETFVSKVLFYLYNDVFKDFGLEEAFFKDENGETMTFASYFDEVGEINEERVEHFITNLGLTSQTSEESDDADEEDDITSNGKRLKYSVNGNGSYGIGEAFLEMSKAIARQPNMTLQKMIDAGKTIRGKDIFLPVASLSEWKQEHVNDSKRDRRFFEGDPIITAGDNIEFVVSTQWGKQRLDKIQEFAASFGMEFEQIAE